MILLISKSSLAFSSVYSTFICEQGETDEKISKLRALESSIRRASQKIQVLKTESSLLEQKAEDIRILKAKAALGFIRTDSYRSGHAVSNSEQPMDVSPCGQMPISQKTPISPGENVLWHTSKYNFALKAEEHPAYPQQSVVLNEQSHREESPLQLQTERKLHFNRKSRTAPEPVVSDSNIGNGLLCVPGFNPSVTKLVGLNQLKLQALQNDELKSIRRGKLAARRGLTVYEQQISDLSSDISVENNLRHRIQLRSEELMVLESEKRSNDLERFELKLSRDNLANSRRAIFLHKVRYLVKAWKMLSCRQSSADLVRRILNKLECRIVRPKIELEHLAPELWETSAFPPSSPINVGHMPFQHDVKLSHVYGYQGRDCKGNLLRNLDGEIIYHVGSLGVISQLTSNTQHVFHGHGTQAITCIALHPDGITVATGSSGISDGETIQTKGRICVWTKRHDHVNHIASLDGGEMESVGSLSFSKDGTQVIAVGGAWPRIRLEIYNWAVSGEPTAKAVIGSDHVMAVECDSSSDAILTCGVGSLKIWQEVAREIKGFRHRIEEFSKKVSKRQHLPQTIRESGFTTAFKECCIPLIEKIHTVAVDMYTQKRITEAKAEADWAINCIDQLKVKKSSTENETDLWSSKLQNIRTSLWALSENCLSSYKLKSHLLIDDDNLEVISILQDIRSKYLNLSLDDQIKLRQVSSG